MGAPSRAVFLRFGQGRRVRPMSERGVFAGDYEAGNGTNRDKVVFVTDMKRFEGYARNTRCL